MLPDSGRCVGAQSASLFEMEDDVSTSTMLVQALAAAPPADTGGGPVGPAWLNTGSVMGMILLAVSIIGGFQGLRMLSGKETADPSKNAKKALSLFIGLLVVLGFTGGVAVAVATGSLDFLVNKGTVAP